MVTAPTPALYTAYNLAYDYFNEKLWDSRLPPVILTFSIKNKKTMGYHYADKWSCPETGATATEIALNPDYLTDRPLVDVLSTLVHEMAHHWQYRFADRPRAGYHDRQWGAHMKSIGLHPSNTGQPGGKETGQGMSHYIIQDGPYAMAFRSLPDEAALPWVAAFADKRREVKRPSKVSYYCGCRRFQAKAGLSEVICGICGEEFEQHSP